MCEEGEVSGKKGKAKEGKSDIGRTYFHNVLIYHSASDTGKKGERQKWHPGEKGGREEWKGYRDEDVIFLCLSIDCHATETSLFLVIVYSNLVAALVQQLTITTETDPC